MLNSHEQHGQHDVDLHFTIDPITRAITNPSGKLNLVQYDHNSERFTFELPQYVEGHDMSLCNVVQVHYLNIENTTKTKNLGVYEVTDLQVETGKDKIVFSWLISSNATLYVGSLNFVIRFSCVGANGVVEYAWHTEIFKDIVIAASINNGDAIVQEYADIIEQWRDELFGNGNGEPTNGEPAFSPIITTEEIEGGYKLTITDAEGTETLNILNGTDGEPGDDGREIELQASKTHIQWRYVNSTKWNNLIALSNFDGQDGTTPHIGENGNWFVGENDTGVKAHGLELDTSLTESGKAADALIVGDRFAELPTIYDWAKQPSKPAYTPAEIGADSSGTAESKITEHNTNETAHNDIRLFIETLEHRINGIADSDDTTLDQLSEIVTYIKTNKSLVDAVTTSKVNVIDIVDNCTTPVFDKPLSAKQGVELKKQINELADMIYPVGSIYISILETSPAELFGGTWEQIKDKFLLACGDIYEPLSTGGAATHTLTIEEMPWHNHKVGTSPAEAGLELKAYQAINVASTGGIEGTVKYYTAGTLPAGGIDAVTQPHNNMPPYSAVYMWKRTA